MANEDEVTIENARIVFRNFAGKEGQYNLEGQRNFAVLLDDEVAEDLSKKNWNIKYLRPRDGDEDPHPQAYVSVSVSFKNRPPRCVIVSSKGRTTLDEDQLEILDWVDIANVDLILNPYSWAVGTKTGIKAYVKAIFVTIEESYLDRKYADVPEIGRGQQLAIEASHDDDIIDGELVED